MTTFTRYLAFQVPGWALIGIVLVCFVRYWELRPGLALALFGAWMAKDFAMYPFVRVAYRPGPANPEEGLVGAAAVAQQNLDPNGYVRVGSELWRAALAPGAAPVPRGGAVRVVAVEGLTLHVEADEGGAESA